MSTLEPAFVIKVCGITCAEDLATSIGAGANAIGFNFYPKSPRYIAPQAAGQFEAPANVLRIGVFVNASAGHLTEVIQRARLDVVQLHGSFDFIPAHVRAWRSLPAGHSPEPGFEAYLLDAPTPEYGGSGRTFDWSLAQAFPFPLIVAGGLDGDNVAHAIASLRPWGVDACSRLESSPGKKDTARVKAFVRSALHASQQLVNEEVSL